MKHIIQIFVVLILSSCQSDLEGGWYLSDTYIEGVRTPNHGYIIFEDDSILVLNNYKYERELSARKFDIKDSILSIGESSYIFNYHVDSFIITTNEKDDYECKYVYKRIKRFEESTVDPTNFRGPYSLNITNQEPSFSFNFLNDSIAQDDGGSSCGGYSTNFWEIRKIQQYHFFRIYGRFGYVLIELLSMKSILLHLQI